METPIKIILLVFTVLSPILKSSAQPYFDIARFSYTSFPINFEEINSDAQLQMLKGTINLGFKVNGEDRILFGWNGEKRKLVDAPTGVYNKAFGLNTINLGYLNFFEQSSWRLLTLGRFKIGSDYDVLTTEDFTWGFTAIASYTNPSDVTFSIGGYYGEELFGQLIFPILGLEWAVSDKTYLYLLFPIEMRAEYALQPNRLYTGINFNWNSSSYGWHNVPQDSYLKIQEFFLNAFLDFQINKNLVLFAETGTTIINDYTIEDDQHRPIFESPFIAKFKNSWVVKLGIAYRLRFKN